SLGVPAGRLANPVRALGALAEIRRGFLDGFPQRLVVRRALHHPFHLISGVANTAQHTAEYASQRTRRARSQPHRRGLESGHESVAAAVAKELELIPLICGVVGVVSCELNQAHGPPWVASRLSETWPEIRISPVRPLLARMMSSVAEFAESATPEGRIDRCWISVRRPLCPRQLRHSPFELQDLAAQFGQPGEV